MAQIIVRNLSDNAVERLKARAKRRHRSLEAEVRDILEEEAVRTPTAGRREEAIRFLDELRAKLAGKMTRDSTDLIREDRAGSTAISISDGALNGGSRWRRSSFGTLRRRQ